MPRRTRKPQGAREESSDEEAKEVHEEVEHDSNPRVLSESEGEDIMENAHQDYRAIGEIDRYEREGIDDEHYDDNPEARAQAEKILRKRDAERLEHDEMDYYLDGDSDLDEDERVIRNRRRLVYEEDENVEVDQGRFNDPEEVKGKLHLWIREDECIRFIKMKFRKFIMEFKDDKGKLVYNESIRRMCNENKQSLFISYSHLKNELATIAMWVAIQPVIIIPELNANAYEVAKKYSPNYGVQFSEVFVRFYDLPIMDHIRDLRYNHLGKIVNVRGVITVRSETFNQLIKIFYKCGKCAYPKGPFFIHSLNSIDLGACKSCQSKGPFEIQRKKTVYRNFQKLTIQESPQTVQPGRIPRSKEFVLFGDCIDIARPGEEVEVVGIYVSRYDVGLNMRQGFPLLSTMIEVNNITKTVDQSDRIHNFREQDIIALSKSHNIEKRIYKSIAPSIYGHDFVKRALTYALFGGVEDTPKNGHKVRGDINVLLLGDPGIAKSQFLKSIQKVFHRCIYTTGKGASAVGLTACVKQDFASKEWKLEAGALVLADKGICLIDEFDKMSEYDRTSIHEAMEQQSISISKAGIVASLRARCSVIAAANPIDGRYDSQKSFSDNVELTVPILSRFDILSVIRDEANEEIDSKLAEFVVNSHMKNHPYSQIYNFNEEEAKPEDEDTIPIELLEHYIRYARDKCFPKIRDDRVSERLKVFYNKLRIETQKKGGIVIGTRHLQSLIRIAAAHAKMFLRNEVLMEDVDVANRTMLESYMQSQKNSQAKNTRKNFSIYLEK